MLARSRSWPPHTCLWIGAQIARLRALAMCRLTDFSDLQNSVALSGPWLIVAGQLHC